jgi:hypothetical protein
MKKFKFATLQVKMQGRGYGTSPFFFTVKTSQLRKHERVEGARLDTTINAESAKQVMVLEFTETQRFPLLVPAGFAGLDCCVDNWSLTKDSAIDFLTGRLQ